jgi:ribonuclease J
VQITIHRNIEDHGGCVELRTDKTRLLIDPELPLKSSLEEQRIDAILVSRYRTGQDGPLADLRKDIPIFLSRGTGELIGISRIFTREKKDTINTSLIDLRKAFNIGDIKITPYEVDHSALDALAFLIEAGGKRLFYSADPRGYSRKSSLFKKMLEHPPADIESLLTR